MREYYIFIISFLLLQFCSTEPENNEPQAELTAIDAAVTETYFNLDIKNTSGDETVNVKRNGNIIATFTAGVKLTFYIGVWQCFNALQRN